MLKQKSSRRTRTEIENHDMILMNADLLHVSSLASITLAARNQTDVANPVAPVVRRPTAAFIFGVEARLEIWRTGILY